MDATQDAAAVVVVVGGVAVTFLVGLAVVLRWAYQAIGKLRRGVHVLDRIEALVNHELQPNHGSSMKDDLTAVVNMVGLLWGRVEAVEKQLGQPERKQP